jgi:endonuclease/exonuclease/phosphatase family metal-dependent hydrolase
VFAGDFNTTPDHHELHRVLAHDAPVDAGDAAGAGRRMTWPADRRLPAHMAPDRVLVDPRSGSDHRALVAALELPRR